TNRQNEEFNRLGLTFQKLGSRPLQLIDCQNLFCEVDKYARLAHPDIDGGSKRMRIKQKYRLNPHPIEYLYPPKWKIDTSVFADT
ncbi:MAG: putative DNA base hypermodification protein, partial [Phycisphaerales bacterium]